MAYETKPNSGSLFSNKDKPDQRENGPDYSGSALIEGVDFFMDAWIKTAESGRKWMSFSFKPKTKQAGNSAPASRGNREEPPPF